MRTTLFPAERIRQWLRRQTMATMDEIKQALGTRVDMTVFRKLDELGCHTSYSHGGRYYALKESVRFDARDLWSCRGVCFSGFGTLVRTAAEFVRRAAVGYTAAELRRELSVEVKGTLLNLVRRQRLAREKVAGAYVYVAAELTRRRQQILMRRDLALTGLAGMVAAPGDATQALKAALVLFASLLDEKERRLWAGLESFRIGHGGDQALASLLDIDPHTVARGRRELLRHDVQLERVRKAGGGRPSVKKNARNH